MESTILENKKGEKIWKSCAWIFFAVFFVFLGFFVGVEKEKKSQSAFEKEIPLINAQATNQEKGKTGDIDFSLFWKVWNTLKEKYVDSSQLDSRKLLYGSIKGMMEATDDPYTVFLDPEENKQFDEDITGKFEGIGAELGIKSGILTVIAPLEDSPAEKAGLRAGDKIIKIDGEAAAEISIDEAVVKIRGRKETQVKLTVFRNGDVEAQEVVITRGIINVKSVKFEMKKDNIAYFKIIKFGEKTNREFSAAIRRAFSSGVEKVILDMRNNPGGYLDVAVDMASKMISKGDIVVVEENSRGEQEKIYAKGKDVLSRMETVILINVGSASASEILAGALRENRDNVTIIGETSYGKGSVQEFVNLPQGTATKITVSKWLTPKGNQINERGVDPDIEVELTYEDFENDRDPQLEKALEVLKSSD